jgi:radical SAM protein with 4Fe4S-binding SPASM domain
MFGYLKEVKNGPAIVSCLITTACNATCPHCSANAIRNLKVQELNTQEWKLVINKLYDAGVHALIFTGGEPLLRSDLENLVKYANEMDLKIAIITNAFELTPQRIDSLYSSGVWRFLLSLDGSFASFHDEFRGLKGCYERVMNAIQIMVDHKIPIGIITALTRLNLLQIPSMIKQIVTLGVSHIRLKNLCKVGRASKNAFLEPTLTEYIELIRKIYDEDKKFPNLYIRYPDLPAVLFEKSIGLGAYEKLVKQGKIGICGAGVIGCAINSRGDVTLCDMSDISFGNLKEKSLMDVWNSLELTEIRNLQLRNLEPCNNCRLRTICLSGCKALPSQFNLRKKIFRNDPLCFECFQTFRNDLQIS